VDLATILIVSNENEFSEAITSAWLSEVKVPSFVVKTGSHDCRKERFDLAIVGRAGDSAGEILEALCSAGRPIIHVSRLNCSPVHIRSVVTLFEVPGWPEAVVSVANQMLEREHASATLSKLPNASSQLEHQAALGRYIIEMRHNLNNALTSILGNCDLILLDENQVSAVIKGQVETIRNMAMRMNEIMQRLSSLQKEMQLVEQQNRLNCRAKGAASGG
jgi:signal transduction histidine kinase